MPDLPRRALLRGTAITAAAMAATSSVARSPDPAEVLAGQLVTVPDRAAMTMLAAPKPGQIVYLDEGEREGFFKCVAGVAPPGDGLQGLAVPSRARGFHYARLWDGVHARPEWFGAVPDDGDADCADAIEACYALCAVTELAQADYFIRRTLRLAQSYRSLRGVGSWSEQTGQGTRIILHRSAPGIHRDDVVLIGKAAQPSAEGGFPRENFIGNFAVMRDGACAPHPSGDVRRYPAGVRIAFVLRCRVKSVSSFESSVGFYIGGTVYTKIDDCATSRRQPGTSAERDFNVGYLLDGTINFGYVGGNASLYLNRCIAAWHHPQHADPIGLLAKGAFVDTFIDSFESAGLPSGMVFAVEGARAFPQTVDTHIRNCVLDGVSKCGILLDLDGTASASIEIVDPYIAMPAGGGDKGIAIQNGAGLVTITGGQIFNDAKGGSLYFTRTFGVRVQGTKIQQASKPVVIDDAGALVLEPQINNFNMTSPHFAIDAKKLVRSSVRPIVNGWQAPAFAGGVRLDATSHHNAIDGSTIDPAWFSPAGPGSKIWYDGADARSGAAGAAFTAAGNRLIGVTD